VTESPQVVGLLVPSKTYGILASGRPLLFVGSMESDVARVVRDAGCGIILSPEDPDAIVAAIRHLRDHPREAEAMGRRGRKAAEQIYDRRHATRRWGQVLRALLEEREPTAPVGSQG
jgi:colanic acid biosynthesis glycosyl transferase WcaI